MGESLMCRAILSVGVEGHHVCVWRDTRGVCV